MDTRDSRELTRFAFGEPENTQDEYNEWGYPKEIDEMLVAETREERRSIAKAWRKFNGIEDVENRRAAEKKKKDKSKKQSAHAKASRKKNRK
ncbi:hypothetical protein TCA2_4623 [Paenibacillus sp. TCA20]|uniref:YfhD family protein n=1 Tax=Paenibacillus urinalis TaxID=521520 RepID=A0ABY7XGX9_9BACL|nr:MULTISPECIES: hypothetical protein [Paenibacillus]WDI05043.1 hypothetical protein PUW25_26095 [Paenibacillus urinalis]GAK42131.1 hypothetical protein TCA2_4623 [Paenibacillus sp. TCA20]